MNPPDPAPTADHGAETDAVGSAARRRALRWALRLVQLGPVVILAILVVVMGILSPYFFKSNNLTNLGFQTAVIAALAIGQLMVILTRGIDLSVGSTVALTGVLAAVVGADELGRPPRPGAGGGARRGLGVGAGQRLHLRRRPRAASVHRHARDARRGPRPRADHLGRGDADDDSGRRPVTIGSGTVGDRAGVDHHRARCRARRVGAAGRGRCGAAGSTRSAATPEAAKRAGLPVGRLLISVYALSGLLAGLAGIITAGRHRRRLADRRQPRSSSTPSPR